jgi:hypothetical protein
MTARPRFDHSLRLAAEFRELISAARRPPSG